MSEKKSLCMYWVGAINYVAILTILYLSTIQEKKKPLISEH